MLSSPDSVHVEPCLKLGKSAEDLALSCFELSVMVDILWPLHLPIVTWSFAHTSEKKQAYP